MERMLEDGNNGRPFYAATRKLAAASPVQPWKVNDLFVGMGPGEVCREVLNFFGGLARTEDAEGMPDLPRVRGGLGYFSIKRTTKLLGASKKTDSRVEGDPLPHLIRTYPASFARPVADIYNEINETGRWPARWKTEHLTIIPKKPKPGRPVRMQEHQLHVCVLQDLGGTGTQPTKGGTCAGPYPIWGNSKMRGRAHAFRPLGGSP